jgi:hypothetical protein
MQRAAERLNVKRIAAFSRRLVLTQRERSERECGGKNKTGGENKENHTPQANGHAAPPKRGGYRIGYSHSKPTQQLGDFVIV